LNAVKARLLHGASLPLPRNRTASIRVGELVR
jgi:hypothetical protein